MTKNARTLENLANLEWLLLKTLEERTESKSSRSTVEWLLFEFWNKETNKRAPSISLVLNQYLSLPSARP